MKRKKNGHASKDERGRFSARRKAEAVIRLLRGEDLDALSRELGVTAATLSSWREQFVQSGAAGLKSRKPEPQDEEVMRLKAMVGELTMRNELLVERERWHEKQGHGPFPSRKSRD
jgi:transposase-like protein